MYNSVNNTPSNDLILDFPMSTYKGQNLFVGMNLAGAETTDRMFPSNHSRIKSVKTIILWYFSRADTKSTKDILREKSIELFEHAKNGSYLDNVKFEIFGDEIANREMVRGAIEATTLMSIGVLLLIVVVSLSTYRRLKGSGFCSISLIVFVSVLSPFLASAAAFGILTWLGFKVYTIMCVTPFLVLGVGVDDAFILIECWTNSKYIKSKKERISAVLVNIGPSITITSLTNTIAFGIGYATPTPQMSLFCLCTSIALFVDYILVFTFLTPVVYLLTKEDSDTEIHPTSKKELYTLSEFRIRKLPRFVEWYADFVTSKKGIFSVAIFLTCIYVISYFGVVTMKSNFEPSKAFPSDSPLANSMDTVRSVFNEFFPINIIVNHPPNITNSTEYGEFNKMVEELESMPESYGKDRTLLWLRHYVEMDRHTSKLFSFLGFGSENYIPTLDNLDFFLDKIGYPPTIKVSNDNGTTKLEAFQFTIIAKNLAEWSNRAITEEECRQILLKYPEFNATIFDGDAAILDLLLTVKTDLIGSIAVTIACMTVICSFFIHTQTGVAVVALIISSICFTLVGLLSWWGADLDPVTMVDVLLATGFSVDFTAHIAHQYYAKKGSKRDRIAISIHEMSMPMIEAGTSTVLCMLPLIFVPTYAIVAFAKTVFLVVGIGLIHGLFVLPVMIVNVPEKLSIFSSCQKQQTEPLTAATTVTTLTTKSGVTEPFL
uniref:SSD domain-containing protein n=1 Tax=Panagrolaimus superbus TaxID=310955 RepID=A0A914Z8X5_9BILA